MRTAAYNANVAGDRRRCGNVTEPILCSVKIQCQGFAKAVWHWIFESSGYSQLKQGISLIC